jgi:hypothetical protein
MTEINEEFFIGLLELFRKHKVIVTYSPGFPMFLMRCCSEDHYKTVIEHLRCDPDDCDCYMEGK